LVYRSDDGGQSWQMIQTGQRGSLWTVSRARRLAAGRGAEWPDAAQQRRQRLDKRLRAASTAPITDLAQDRMAA